MSESAAHINVAVNLPVPAARAYQAWVDASDVQQWWGQWPAGEAPQMTFEPEPGGNWRFAMSLEDGVQWVSGKVVSLAPGQELSLTFHWEGADELHTPVTLTFSDLANGGSTLKLHHDQSLGGNACADGWNWSLGCLRGFLERELKETPEKEAAKPS